MFSQYFGQYLLNQRILSADQLGEVLELEKSVHVKLGILAMDAGYMTPLQVEQVHELQRSHDKRFGQLATEQGFLTPEQVTNLLAVQDQKYLSLSQAIVDKHYLTLAQVNSVLDRYKTDNHLSDAHVEALVTGDVDQIVRFSLDFGSSEQAERYYHYLALMMRNIIRFLGETPVVLKNSSVTNQKYDWVISQVIAGQAGLLTELAVTDAALLTIAARYSEEAMATKVDDYAQDCVAEFLNVTNGVYCVNASNLGVELDLEPQQVQGEVAFSVGGGTIIPIQVSFGTLYFRIL
jgi:CheY-specific phosphatase CheX